MRSEECFWFMVSFERDAPRSSLLAVPFPSRLFEIRICVPLVLDR